MNQLDQMGKQVHLQRWWLRPAMACAGSRLRKTARQRAHPLHLRGRQLRAAAVLPEQACSSASKSSSGLGGHLGLLGFLPQPFLGSAEWPSAGGQGPVPSPAVEETALPFGF